MSLRSFKIQRLTHSTHRQAADKIVSDSGFLPFPYIATAGSTFEQRLENIEGDTITTIIPLRGEVCPGKYVWFSVDTDLSLDQKEACRRILGLTARGNGKEVEDHFYQQPLKFSDFIENHSRYGNWTFRIDLVTLLENYRHSRRMAGSPTLPDIYFKLGGTKRYKNTATYIILVCAVDPYSGFDPLPKFPTLRRTEILEQTIFDPRGLLDELGRVKLDSHCNIIRGAIPEFHPLGITVGEFNQEEGQWFYHDWDQLDFAFHFPTDFEGHLHCGVFPGEIHHTYCVPLKRKKLQRCEVCERQTVTHTVPPHLVERFN